MAEIADPIVWEVVQTIPARPSATLRASMPPAQRNNRLRRRFLSAAFVLSFAVVSLLSVMSTPSGTASATLTQPSPSVVDGAAVAEAARLASQERGRRLFAANLAEKQASNGTRTIVLVDKLAPSISLPSGILDNYNLNWFERRPAQKHNKPPGDPWYEALLPADRVNDFKAGEAARGRGDPFLSSNVHAHRPGYAVYSCPSSGTSWAAKQEKCEAVGAVAIASVPPPATDVLTPSSVESGSAPPPQLPLSRRRAGGAIASTKVGCTARFSTAPSKEFDGFAHTS